MPDTLKKLRLQGFNNLTKTLSFNIDDVCYAESAQQREAYIHYIDGAYNAERLTGILTDVANIIGATIRIIARQDYDPQGASVTLSISEEEVSAGLISNETYPGPLPEAVVGHLDKSHIAVHTYPESNASGISTFRADIDVSTCGRISPLRALNYLIHSFESDIVSLDYRVRGFTRDLAGRKRFIDHNIGSIQNYLSRDTKERYQAVDVNVYQENIFHTKMAVGEFRLNDYLFCVEEKDLAERERRRIHRLVRREVAEICYGRNLARNLEFRVFCAARRQGTACPRVEQSRFSYRVGRPRSSGIRGSGVHAAMGRLPETSSVASTQARCASSVAAQQGGGPLRRGLEAAPGGSLLVRQDGA